MDNEQHDGPESDPTPDAPAPPRSLATREVVLLGMSGGFVGAVIGYPTDNVFFDPDTADLIRLFCTLVFGVLVGGLWSYIHIPEHNRLRAFQFGLIAPAVIASLIYAHTPDQPDDPDGIEPSATLNVEDPGVVLYAATTSPRIGTLDGIFSREATERYEYRKHVETAQTEKKRKRRKKKSWWERVFG